jgi:hypothetical protein
MSIALLRDKLKRILIVEVGGVAVEIILKLRRIDDSLVLVHRRVTLIVVSAHANLGATVIVERLRETVVVVVATTLRFSEHALNLDLDLIFLWQQPHAITISQFNSID